MQRTAPDTIRLERMMPGSAERLWSWLVDEEKRRLWFAGGAIDARAGGKGTLHFQHANITDEPTPQKYAAMDDGGFFSQIEVLACDPPRLLSYTWPNGAHVSQVTFELTPEGDGTRLVLTHRRLRDTDELISVSGGWHAHLDLLAALLEGRRPGGFWSHVTQLDARYRKAFAGPL